jgi:hypothetical protein
MIDVSGVLEKAGEIHKKLPTFRENYLVYEYGGGFLNVPTDL